LIFTFFWLFVIMTLLLIPIMDIYKAHKGYSHI
jgi:hypothetical protein